MSGYSRRPPLAFAELFQDIGKGVLPLSKESVLTFVLRCVDKSGVDHISRREAAGEAGLRAWNSHGRRIDIGRSHDAAGQ